MPETPPAVHKLTPPEVARRFGVSPDKVLIWIRNGELRAVNVATTPNGCPRFAIDAADLASFEQLRAAQTRPAAAPRRRKAAAGVIEYF